MYSPKRKSLVALSLGALAVWVSLVVASGAGWNPFWFKWNFANTGAFGDSFGPFGAIMAGLAAVAAFEALREQRKEIRRAEARDVAEDRRREAADAAAERQRRLRQASESRALFE